MPCSLFSKRKDRSCSSMGSRKEGLPKQTDLANGLLSAMLVDCFDQFRSEWRGMLRSAQIERTDSPPFTLLLAFLSKANLSWLEKRRLLILLGDLEAPSGAETVETSMVVVSGRCFFSWKHACAKNWESDWHVLHTSSNGILLEKTRKKYPTPPKIMYNSMGTSTEFYGTLVR